MYWLFTVTRHGGWSSAARRDLYQSASSLKVPRNCGKKAGDCATPDTGAGIIHGQRSRDFMLAAATKPWAWSACSYSRTTRAAAVSRKRLRDESRHAAAKGRQQQTAKTSADPTLTDSYSVKASVMQVTCTHASWATAKHYSTYRLPNIKQSLPERIVGILCQKLPKAQLP